MKYVHRRLLGSPVYGIINGFACFLDGVIDIFTLGYYTGGFSVVFTTWLYRRKKAAARLKYLEETRDLYDRCKVDREKLLTGYNTLGKKIVGERKKWP